MDELDNLRRITGSMVENLEERSAHEAPHMMEKAAQALKLIAEVDKSRAKARKLSVEERRLNYDLDHAPQHDRSEQIRDYVSLLTPILTTAILAATLVMQGYQFTQAEKDKRIATEEAQWADAVRTLSQSNKLSPSAAILSPF